MRLLPDTSASPQAYEEVNLVTALCRREQKCSMVSASREQAESEAQARVLKQHTVEQHTVGVLVLLSTNKSSTTFLSQQAHLVPSDTACLASSPGRMRRTAVWISRDEMVDFLL